MSSHKSAQERIWDAVNISKELKLIETMKMNKLDKLAAAYNNNPSEMLYEAYMVEAKINNERILNEEKARYAVMVAESFALQLAA